MNGAAAISSALRHRILRARKTGKEREFELMLALRPDRKAVVAEGDSWLAYPPRNFVGANSRSNLVNCLTALGTFNLLQLASNGDEAVHMLTGASKHRLVRIISRFPIDTLLFSGGGNDLVGVHDFDFLLRDGAGIDSDECADYVHADRVSRRLQAVETAYRDLLAYCDEYSLNRRIRVVSHCYDYALPSARGARFAGGLFRPAGGRSWMHPHLMARNIPPRHHQSIVNYLIDGLAERLLALAHERPGRFTAVDTRGTLRPEHWINEIHPGPAGFRLIAARILPEI